MRHAIICAVLVLIAPSSRAQTDEVSGVWRGQSLCSADRPACTNENVVYYIHPVAGKRDAVSIRADKIVDGKAITMGEGEWQHDASRHELVWEMPRQTWLLHVQGTTIEGTLTLADKTVVRRMTLKKDP